MDNTRPDYSTEPATNGAVPLAQRLLSFPAGSAGERDAVPVFEDPASRQLLAHVERIAYSDATVLIIGETGTGKELIARRIHAASARRKGPFGAVNCAALSETLIESELFGHEKGAFTGAVTGKIGWFETAHGGTLFLDEVSDLPLGLQAKLLRVLQEREVVRVGARQSTPIDIRVIAATNVDLEEAVAAGLFRADLYYRLSVVTVHPAPLRDRPGDILPLAHHFLAIFAERLGRPGTGMTPEAKRLFLNYDWPGNIRELENAIHRALLVSPGLLLRQEDFMLSTSRPLKTFSPRPASPTQGSLENLVRQLCERPPPQMLDMIEETVIRTAFDYCKRNQVQTAGLLNISRNVLRHRLAAYGLIRERRASEAGSFGAPGDRSGP